MTSLGLETRAIRMSRARAPNSTGAPSLVSSRSLGTRRKGPNDRTSLLDAALGTIAFPACRPYGLILGREASQVIWLLKAWQCLAISDAAPHCDEVLFRSKRGPTPIYFQAHTP